MKQRYLVYLLSVFVLTTGSAFSKTLNLVITGGTQSQLEAVNGLGGFEARAAYFQEISRQATPSVFIDTGGFMPNIIQSPIDRAAATISQQAMKHLSYDARSLSVSDLKFGWRLLNKLVPSLTEFTATNVVLLNGATHNRPFHPYKIIEAESIKLGVLAYSSLNNGLNINDEFMIQHAHEKLDSLITQLREEAKVDGVILIVNEASPLVLPWLNQYTGQRPEIIIAQSLDVQQNNMNGLWIISAPGTGNAVTKAVLKISKQAGVENLQPERVVLKAEGWENEPMRDFLQAQYNQQVQALGLEAVEPYPLMGFNAEQSYTNGYAGAARCLECHEAQYQQWRETAHATTFKRLIETNRHWVPEIVQYHVTGYGHDVGYKGFARSPHLRNVQCETCHGPGQNHVDEFGTGEIRRGSQKAMCMECHTAERTPDFEEKFDLYYKKIVH